MKQLKKSRGIGLLSHFIIGALLFCRLTPMLSYAAGWPSPEALIEALSGIVMDIDSGAVLYEKDADLVLPPASTTKVLTALIVLEQVEDLNGVVTFSNEAVSRVEADSGNKIQVMAGDRLTVKDCLYALLLCSSNQTANALAEYVGGSIEGFVVMMNEKAAELGLISSHFENPSGLNGDTHNVTARELALIAKAAYDNPLLLEISSAVSYQLPAMAKNPNGLTISNSHQLVKTADEASSYYLPAAKAGKTGYLKKAGNTLITYAEEDGRRLVSIVLKGSSGQYFLDGKRMLQFGFTHFTNYQIAEYDRNEITVPGLSKLLGPGYITAGLTINPEGVLTLPAGEVFSAAKRTVTLQLPDGHPEDAVALLEYTYQGQLVGSAYVSYSLSGQTD